MSDTVVHDQPKTITVDDITLTESERTPCEVWTRVMGYFRPKDGFNIGKQAEFRERKYFVEDKI